VTLGETRLEELISMSKLGKYEIVKLTLEWIEIMRQNEEYKKLTQFELINKALNNVLTNVAKRKKTEGEIKSGTNEITK